MKIVIAPNTYKGSLNAVRASECIKNGLLKVFSGADLIMHPIADGGDHTLEVIVKKIQADIIPVQSVDPLGREIGARYAILKDKSAVIEMAVASGIHLLKNVELNPAETSSYGTGILINDAVNKGCRRIYLGVGGTANMDGGTGILKAMGFRFLDKDNNELPEGGGYLMNFSKIEYPSDYQEFKKIEFIILSDVNNPLTGESGAARVYSPQKGADKEMVEKLEKSLNHFAEIILRETDQDISGLKSGGAAGGTPAGLFPFLNITITSGTEKILDMTGFRKNLENCDLLITGEGKLDEQTFHGKAPFIAAQIAKKENIPVFFIAGMASVPMPEQAEEYFNAVFSKCNKSSEIDYSMRYADLWLTEFSEKIGKLISLGIYIS